MENEIEQVVPDTTTDAPAQTTPVVKEQTTTPEVVSVPLADWTATQERLANLERQQRTAQSDKDKKKAQINKSFARKIQAVDEMKEDEGWDEKEVRQRKKAYADEAAMQTLELEGLADDEPTPTQAQAPTAPPARIGVSTADEQRAAFAKTLARFELTEKDVDLTPFLNQRVNTPQEAEAFDDRFFAAITKAQKTKLANVNKTAQELLDEAEAQRVADTVDQFGGLGGNNNRGAPGDSGRRNSKDLNADIGAAYNAKYAKTQPR